MKRLFGALVLILINSYFTDGKRACSALFMLHLPESHSLGQLPDIHDHPQYKLRSSSTSITGWRQRLSRGSRLDRSRSRTYLPRTRPRSRHVCRWRLKTEVSVGHTGPADASPAAETGQVSLPLSVQLGRHLESPPWTEVSSPGVSSRQLSFALAVFLCTAQ